MEEKSPLPKVDQQPTYTCMGCRVKFISSELQRNHFKTDWHLYNLKRRVCNLEPIELSAYDIIVAASPKQPSSNDSDKKSEHPPEKTSISEEEDDDDDDWEDVGDHEEFSDEDYDEEEAAEMLANVIESDHCLFCDKKSSGIKANLHHMNLHHGFFIPEDQYLIDLEGIMKYLGFKVGAGATCLWCNKQFISVQGARLHMIYKNHCKILYEHEKAIDEFKDFYDYTAQAQIPMKPLNQLVIPRKRSEKRADYSRTVALGRQSFGQPSLQLVANKNIKKFNAYRAKIILRTGMANNYTMRGRLRQQNPI